MSFHLKRKESLCRGICRIARDQNASILRSLEEKRADCQSEAIHNARTSVKKVRSLLRLVCDDLGKRVFKRENQTYRDIGRKLSAARDTLVLTKTLERLRKKNQDQTTSAIF